MLGAKFASENVRTNYLYLDPDALVFVSHFGHLGSHLLKCPRPETPPQISTFEWDNIRILEAPIDSDRVGISLLLSFFSAGSGVSILRYESIVY